MSSPSIASTRQLAVQLSPPAFAGVSPRMAGLIADFQRLSGELDAAEHSDDLFAWDRAAETRGIALDDLVFERPVTLADFAAKMRALATFMVNEDAELFVFMRLAEDAALLTRSAMK